MKKARADAKLQNLPEERQAELWRLLHPEDGGQPMTLEGLAAALPGLVGFGVAVSTLGSWHAWYALKRRMDGAAQKAEQTRLRLAKDPDFTPETIARAADMVFTAEALEDGNFKAYVALERLRLTKAKHALERQRLDAAAKSKIEAGLEALYQEIKGNPRAEAKFAELQAEVAKA